MSGEPRLPAPERWRHLEALFQTALELPPALRAVYLDRECAGDPAVRAAIEQVIGASEDAEGFLEALVMEALRRERDYGAEDGSAR